MGDDGAPGDGIAPPRRRPIRSFVLRQGRASEAQLNAVERLLPVYGIPYATTPPDFDRVFGRQAPRVLEVGFGMGETTAEIAAAHPEIDYVGIEVHTPGVGALLRRLEQRALGNVRVIHHDAVEVLHHMIAPDSLAAIHVFFPDPWPKKRHHKRRLLQAPFVRLLAQRLRAGGTLHVATDWRDYAEHILAVLGSEPLLVNTATEFAPRPQWRPITKFEGRGIRLGHERYDLVFRKRA
jgi:tRNA (guanine-N7-)-methyltransferase